MIFTPTELAGAYVIEPERFEDARGFFARTWCPRELEAHGLNPRLAQCSVTFNRLAGTVRGMHFQTAPHEEAKIVRCTAGAIHDVIIDLRPGSPTRRRWISAELSAENRRALYVPEGFAHGYITLRDDSEVLYMITEFHAPASARGVRWDDPAFGVTWPLPVRVIADRDRSYPDYAD
jgi:dTDP-4-dehydrorhamnose 3,5-epimerase